MVFNLAANSFGFLLRVFSGILPNAAKVVGTVVIIGVPALYVWWKRAVRARVQRKLQIIRDPSIIKEKKKAFSGEVLDMLEVDPSMLCKPPFNVVRLISLPDYLASLAVLGDVNMEGAIITAAQHIGLHAVLPLAMFLPKQWRQTDDIRKTFSSSYMGSILAADLLSLQTITAGGNIMHSSHLRKQRWQAKSTEAKKQLAAEPESQGWDVTTAALATNNGSEPGPSSSGGSVADQQTDATPDPSSPLFMLWNGCSQQGRDIAQRLPNPFVISRDLEAVLALESGVTDQPHKAPPPVAVSPFFPDLYTGDGGLRMSHPPRQCRINELMAVVLNRLVVNAIPGNSGCWKPEEEFVVQLTEDGRRVTTLEDLIEEFERIGSQVGVRIASNLTSFSCSITVKCNSETSHDGASWLNVPLAIPMDTGLVTRGADGGFGSSVMTFMSHASVWLDVSGPTLSFQQEWCLSIVGVTKFESRSGVDRPFQLGPEVMSWHSDGAFDGDPIKVRRTMRLLTAASVVATMAGQKNKLLFGGYGLLGVCCDSVAAIQAAVTGSTSLYPLSMGGKGKIMLLAQYKETAGMPGWPYRQEALELATAIRGLPCDSVVEPEQVPDTARRIKACLPPVCVFSCLPKIKADLDSAIEYATSLLE